MRMIPVRLHRGRRAAQQVLDGPGDDQHAGGDQDGALGERRQVLGLAVAEVVRSIGRAHGDTDGEQSEQGRDEIGSGVDRLGEEAKRVGGEGQRQLDADERTGSHHRDERGAPRRGPAPLRRLGDLRSAAACHRQAS